MTTNSEQKNGTLDILNCREGHMTFDFNKDDLDEVKKARQAFQDMKKLGYVIMAEIDGETVKVADFDPETNSYIIEPPKEKKGKKGGRRKVPTTKARATAFGATSGG